MVFQSRREEAHCMAGYSVVPQLAFETLWKNVPRRRLRQRLLIANEPHTHLYFDREILLDEILASDTVVFISRLGDQLRFSEMPKGPTFVACFTLNSRLLGSSFGTADHNGFVELKEAVDRYVSAAKTISISCPAGTKVTGHAIIDDSELTDTSSLGKTNRDTRQDQANYAAAAFDLRVAIKTPAPAIAIPIQAINGIGSSRTNQAASAAPGGRHGVP